MNGWLKAANPNTSEQCNRSTANYFQIIYAKIENMGKLGQEMEGDFSDR